MNNFPEIPKNLFGKSTQQFALSDPNNVDASKSSLSNTQAMEQLKAFEQGMSFDADLQSKVNASKPQNPTNGRRKVNSIIQTPNIKSNLPSIDEESYNNKNQNENFLLSRERNHDFMDMNETNQVLIATGTFDLNQLIGSDSCILEVLLQDSTDKVSDKIVESSFLPLEPLSVKVELQIAHPLSGFKIQDNNLNFIIVQDVNEELIDILNRMKDQIFKLNQLQKVSIAHPSQQSIIQLIPNLTQPKQLQQQQNILQSQQQTFAVPPKISKSSNSGQQNQQQNPSQQITTLNPPPPLTRLTRNRSLSPQGASSDQNKTVDSVSVSSLNSSQEKDKLTQKELNTTQGLNSTQNEQLKTSGIQPKSMPKPPQPDQIQSQSDPNEFDPLVCQSEFEFEGQDFAEIEKVIPIDKLYPSNVLYREIDAVDKVKYLISRDKNNANKYENVQLLDARRAQADALANKIGEDFESNILNNDIYKQKLKEMQEQFKKKLLTQTSKKASNDQEKRRNEGLKHHIRGIILHLKDEIENADAATEIRRAHLNKKQFDTLSGMIEQLDILENNIQMANTTKIYAQALDEGAAQFKAIIGDLTPEKIQAKVDAVQDMQSNLEEINRVIQGATNIGIDDDDIQAELAFLTAQAEEEERNPKAQQTQKQFAIPKVPTREIYISQPQLESDAQFEAQLAALTEGM
ncbi:MAG: hypothetical protein EZS28_001818 [Streblomastix strix]|uniref:Uncharacterized protein n=1 Tax=Streblomastix strix TaxID=222440 RepID=A0A5J4X5Y6_9EUKA|nr:MAG: hypothetical protein EZS28_001818 [Streblomastix strix]